MVRTSSFAKSISVSVTDFSDIPLSLISFMFAFRDVCAGIIIVREAGGLVVDGCGRDVTDGELLTGRRILTVRGCCGEDGDASAEASAAAQRKIVKEVWNVVEDIDCPRK